MLRVKTYLIIVHIAGWLLFMAFPLLFLNGGNEGNHSFMLLKSPYYWLFCFTYVVLFYINAYFFIPYLFLKKEYFKYALVAIVLLTGIYFLQPYDKLLRHGEHHNIAQFDMGPPPMGNRPPEGSRPPMQPPGGEIRPNGEMGTPPPRPQYDHPQPPGMGRPPFGRPYHMDVNSIFIFLMIMALSAATKTIQQWQLTEQRVTQAEADKASAELSFLKAQINPHFLFNTLNNIYTLAITKNEHTADSIMKLSNIMRYVTDDVTDDFVPLQSEIDCISDYIELQRLRIGEKTSIDVYISGDIGNKQIAPLILMTFIENVFKYGISKHTRSVIVIKIIGNETGISFFCQNRIFPEKDEKQRAGIGLKNTMQRLDHLYPSRYKLDIDTEAQ